ncbi:MAG: Gfo/Idh/MocA family oxidoreductase [Verrucomicrobiae bacterium]|nr:Gfo/Idh/MocA family oxidoreductase [Verrucomicrobiae bacterium]
MSATIRVAVIGVGHLGKEHARVYADLDRAHAMSFVGVFDSNSINARHIAERHGVRAFETIEKLIDECDAASIATPTPTHFEIGKLLIERGKHVLVEKPITESAVQAEELVRLAQQRDLILQVGHVERFNPVLKYLEGVATHPRFIEVHRLSPYPSRSIEIGVVLDLMIHDLDVVLSLVRSPLAAVDAVGIPVLSVSEDIANARLRFENGCVANLTVSRISPEKMRKIRVFSGAGVDSTAAYISLDYMRQEGEIYRIAGNEERESSLLKKLIAGKDAKIVSEFAGKKIVREPVPIEKDEPLKLELASFVDCVRQHRQPVVSGATAKRALDVALQITDLIRAGK